MDENEPNPPDDSTEPIDFDDDVIVVVNQWLDQGLSREAVVAKLAEHEIPPDEAQPLVDWIATYRKKHGIRRANLQTREEIQKVKAMAQARRNLTIGAIIFAVGYLILLTIRAKFGLVYAIPLVGLVFLGLGYRTLAKNREVKPETPKPEAPVEQPATPESGASDEQATDQDAPK